MMKILLKRLGPLSLIFLCLVSCDILRLSLFEVADWGPGDGYKNDPQNIPVFLAFSREPDRSSVEKNFSLSDDAGQLRGTFHWENNTMTFVSTAPLEINRDYAITLTADARDVKGLSLERSFEGRFTTRGDDTRPLLLSCVPAMNAAINDPRAEVRLEFSLPVSLVSLRNNVSFSPHMNGSWRLEDKAAVFTPVEPWAHGKRHEIRVTASLSGDNGMTMGGDFLSVFHTGTDCLSPRLDGAWRITKNNGNVSLSETAAEIFTENAGWENGDRIRLKFSKPVDSLSVNNCLSAEGAPLLTLESTPGFSDELVFLFEKDPVYESRFTLALRPGVKDVFGNESEDEHEFRFYVNGVHSKPPALAGIRLPLAPGNADNQELAVFVSGALFEDLPINDGPERYPFSRETETWIECYFEISPGASVDPFSVMELFKINTSNNVLDFSPLTISGNVFSVSTPEPRWKEYQRLEIRGKLTNTVNSGVINIEIAPGLKDSAGNTNEKTFRISLLK